MEIYLLFGLLSLVGVILGAVLQFMFSKRAESRRNVDLRRTEAYVELIRSVAALTSADADTSPDELRQIERQYAEARARIVIYGSGRVASSLRAFIETPSGGESEGARAALADLVAAMRADGLGAGAQLADQDVKRILFGRE